MLLNRFKYFHRRLAVSLYMYHTKLISNTNFGLQILKAGEWNCSHCVLISNDKHGFLFNCGEGINRDMLMSSNSSKKLQTILVTQKKWANVSGLLELMIAKSAMQSGNKSMAENGSCVDFIGPPNCDGVIHSDRSFSLDIGLGLNVVDVNHAYSKQGLEITPVRIGSKSVSAGRLTPYSSQHDPTDNYCLCYICKTDPTEQSDPLVFMVVDCPNRSYFKSLFGNKLVMKLQNGSSACTVVHLTPFLVAENEEYTSWMNKFGSKTQHLLVNERSVPDIHKDVIVQQVQHNLIEANVFPLLPFPEQNCQQTSCSGRINAVRNLTFNMDDIHISAENMRLKRLLYTKSYVEDLKRNMGSDRHFTDMVEKAHENINSLQNSFNRDKENPREIIVSGLNTYTSKEDIWKHFPSAIDIDIQKKARNDYRTKSHSARVVFADDEDVTLLYKRHSSGTPLKILGQIVKLEKLDSDCRNGIFPEVVFLGTGTSNTSTIQSQAAINVHCSADKCILLDCGAGTWPQMCKFYGLAQAKDVLRKLTAVFISHLHIDHHTGLISILKERANILRTDGIRYPKPVTIFCSKPFSHWLHSISVMGFLDSSTYEIAAAEDMQRGVPKMSTVSREEIGIKRLKMVGVEHKQFPLGICLKFENDFSLVYSGDTRPSDNLVRAGDNCDLLIHEASYPDDLLHRAIKNLHSCTTEAINTGIAMRAGHTILTHLGYANNVPQSAQYPNNSNVSYAVDFMRVRPCDLKKLAHISNAVSQLRNMAL